MFFGKSGNLSSCVVYWKVEILSRQFFECKIKICLVFFFFFFAIFFCYWPTDTSKHKCRKPNSLKNLPYHPTNKTGKIVWGHCVLSILKLLKPKRKQQKHVFQPYKCLSATVLTSFGITVTVIFEFSVTVDFPQAFHLRIHHIQKQINRKG